MGLGPGPGPVPGLWLCRVSGRSEQSAAGSPGAPLVWGWKQSQGSTTEGRLWLRQSQAGCLAWGRMRPRSGAVCMQGTPCCPLPCPASASASASASLQPQHTPSCWPGHPRKPPRSPAPARGILPVVNLRCTVGLRHTGEWLKSSFSFVWEQADLGFMGFILTSMH